MSTRLRRAAIAVLACLSALALADPASAEKPGGPPGHAKRGSQDPAPQAAAPGLPNITVTISPRDRLTIQRYFGQQFSSGHCPPGLAKKNNGCLPPGQVKKWTQGQPLAAGVPYYLLPQALLGQLTPPPLGYQYIRIADDVLLMASGSRMFMDAVRDLGGM
jgi:hypothetical protein